MIDLEKMRYQGYYIYKDQKIPIKIENDGEILSFNLHGVQFEGDEFSDFKSTDKLEGDILNYVELWNCKVLNLGITEQYLSNCIFEVDIPQQLINKSDRTQSTILLHVEYTLGKERPKPKGGLDNEELVFRLNLNNKEYVTDRNGCFETAFDKLMKDIGEDYYFKNCYGCLYSDYNVYGQASFGGMQCFYENRDNYLKATEKIEFAELEGYQFVQETFVCNKFVKREPGIGYRG